MAINATINKPDTVKTTSVVLQQSRASLGLNNVTNESKATMFNSPTFTESATVKGTLNVFDSPNGVNRLLIKSNTVRGLYQPDTRLADYLGLSGPIINNSPGGNTSAGANIELFGNLPKDASRYIHSRQAYYDARTHTFRDSDAAPGAIMQMDIGSSSPGENLSNYDTAKITMFGGGNAAFKFESGSDADAGTEGSTLTLRNLSQRAAIQGTTNTGGLSLRAAAPDYNSPNGNWVGTGILMHGSQHSTQPGNIIYTAKIHKFGSAVKPRNDLLTINSSPGPAAATFNADVTIENNLSVTGDITDPTFTGTITGLDKSDVGLSNVTNESKATMFTDPTFTGTVSGVTATHVGLGNVTNESKATMFTNPTFTGTVNTSEILSSQASLAGLIIRGRNNQSSGTGGKVVIKGGLGGEGDDDDGNVEIGLTTTNLVDLGATRASSLQVTGNITNPTFAGTITGLDKSDVGLNNVTNESKATMFTSAALTGTPTTPTAAAGTDTTQIASTAFVNTAIANNSPNYEEINVTNINMDGHFSLLIPPENRIDGQASALIKGTSGRAANLRVVGPVTVTHDLFKNSGDTGGFADNSNHFHTIQKINRITQQSGPGTANERVQEQYYAIENNNLKNSKAAFWNWHRVSKEVSSTAVSLINLVGWDVSGIQDSSNRTATSQVLFPTGGAEATTFTFDTAGNNPFVLNDVLRITVDIDFEGAIVAATNFAKVTAVSGATATVVLYGGNYKTTDEVADGNSQTAVTTGFSVKKIDTAQYMPLASGTGIDVLSDSTRTTTTDTFKITFASAHGLELNDTVSIITDNTGGFQAAEVAFVKSVGSTTEATFVYGRVFEPESRLALSDIGSSSVVGVLKGTLDGLHRFTAGDQLMHFNADNQGRYKSYQIGPGSEVGADCIAIGKNVYNKDASTIKIGYDNNMLNIDSAGIDVAGTINTTGNITTPRLVTNEIQCIGTTSGTAQPITYDSKEHRFRDYDAIPNNLMVIKKVDGVPIGKVGINHNNPVSALHVVGGHTSGGGISNEALRVVGSGLFTSTDDIALVVARDTDNTFLGGAGNNGGHVLKIKQDVSTSNTAAIEELNIGFVGVGGGGIYTNSTALASYIQVTNNRHFEISTGGHKSLSLSGSTGAASFISGASFGGNVTISGNLNVSGTATGISKSMVGLGNVTNESKATMFTSATLTGTPTAPTASAATNNTQIATTAYTTTAINNLINGAPGALNTLNEIAEALNDSPAQIDNILSAVGQRLVIGNNLSDLNNAGTARTNLALGNVTNESKSTMFSNPTFTGTVSGVTATHVGLGNVTNESKATMFTGAALTGTPTAPTAGAGTNTTQIATTAFVTTAISNNSPNYEVLNVTDLNVSGTATGISKSMVGLGNVDNTADAFKPVSIATQTALNLKANIASPTFTGTVSGVTATHVGLGNVTNESKSTMFTDPTFTGTVSGVTATHVGLGNVTNESKSTMFTDPTFTGTVSGVTATHVGLGNVTNESKATMFSGSTFTGTTAATAITIPNSAGGGSFQGFPSLLNLQASDELRWVYNFGNNTWGSSYVKGWYVSNSGDLNLATYGNTTHDPQMTWGNDGTVTIPNDLLVGDKIVHNGDTNTAIRFPSNDTITFETSGSERLRIKSSGEVGIGKTATTGVELDVSGDVAASGTITSTSSTKRPVQNDESDDTPIRNIRKVTQAQYDALTPDANTLYVIV